MHTAWHSRAAALVALSLVQLAIGGLRLARRPQSHGHRSQRQPHVPSAARVASGDQQDADSFATIESPTQAEFRQIGLVD